LARRLPQADIYGVDISKKSLAILQKAAKLNAVHVNVDTTVDEFMRNMDLVICDVEGDEINYLRPDWFSDLLKADIIVECHDTEDYNMSRILYDRFCGTHNIEQIFEGARDPNKYLFLRQRESLHRWMAVCEGRPCTMNWLVMKVKQ